jgi:beta-aspartyl-peptidase (threonine type)
MALIKYTGALIKHGGMDMNNRPRFVYNLILPGILVLLVIFPVLDCSNVSKNEINSKFGIVIHGGGGVRERAEFERNPDLETSYRDTINEALSKGYEILETGGSSVDAVEAAIRVMEDFPLFNAGKGASFTLAGTNELDASIMNGKTLRAGAVGAVKFVKNPISLAKLVMQRTPHVLLVGEGALAFAKEQGAEIRSADYFYTERQWTSLQRRIKEDVPYGGDLKEKREDSDSSEKIKENNEDKFGTVGAVALDKNGNLAAGTSTGGRVKKRPGRVGDSPIIGASTYANNQTCAVSTTGLGEKHLVLLTSKEISALTAYKGMALKEAVDHVIMKELVDIGGSGGAVAIDKNGNVAMSFTGEGMYRGFILDDGKAVVKIYKE